MATALPDDGQVGGHAEGRQRGQLGPGSAGNFAGGVQVLHAHQPLAMVVTREQPAAQGRHQRAEMQAARGRGREASPVAGVGKRLGHSSEVKES